MEEVTQRGSGDTPTDPRLLADPLVFISDDHLRERQICAMIDRVATVPAFDRQAGLTVLRFLNEELNVHMRDEAEDLFPLLAERCTAEDAIEGAIARIQTDQKEAMRLIPPVRTALSASLDTGCDLSTGDRQVLHRFAGAIRRHLVAENAILLPIARARLTEADLLLLSRRMRLRRGLSSDLEQSNAE